MGGGGKGASGAEQAGQRAAETQARISEALFRQTGPLRGQLFGTPATTTQRQTGFENVPIPGFAAAGQIASGTLDPGETGQFPFGQPGQQFQRRPIFETTTTPATQGRLSEILDIPAREPIPRRPISPIARETAERQAQIAGQQIQRSTPRGGLQRRLLADVQIGRAQTIAQLAAQEEEQDFQREVTEIQRGEELEREEATRALQVSSPVLGQTQLGVSGLGGSAGALAQFGSLETQRQAATAQMLGQLGGGVGTIVGLGKLGKGSN